jgi:hypothetical protein
LLAGRPLPRRETKPRDRAFNRPIASRAHGYIQFDPVPFGQLQLLLPLVLSTQPLAELE